MRKKPEAELPDVRHIVVAMFENRSFDNVFGWAYSALKPPHFVPPGPLKRFNGLTLRDLQELANPALVNNVEQMFPPSRGFTPTRINRVWYMMPPPVDPNEEFSHMTAQIYGPFKPGQKPPADGNMPPGSKPTMKGFAADYMGELGSNPTADQIARVMECASGSQVYPFHLLAYAYAVSDAWFGSCPTQTNPNRAFLACGTSQGKVNNSASGIDVFTADTVWNRLSEHGVSWKIYWENAFPPDLGSMPWTRQCFSRIKDMDDSYFPRMSQFHRDARTGNLPFFSFIEPSWTLETNQHGFQGNDLHPPGDIRPGLQFLSALYTSLASNPEAFQKTVLLITFDEHGGTYDHVPPPNTAKPDTPRTTGFRFDRFGPRVPTVLVSPMVEPGTVFRSLKGLKTPYDHTSIPATILTLAGVPKEKWKLFDRVDVAPTFEGVLTRAKSPRTEVRLGPGTGDWEEEPPQASGSYVSFGDAFVLRYATSGDYQNRYVTADSTKDGTSLWLTSDKAKAMRFRFTMGYAPGTVWPVGMNVRTPAAVYIQYASPTWGPDARNEAYLRVPDTKLEVAQWCQFGKDDQWWYSTWYVSHPSRSLLAWQISWGDAVFLEYHELNGNTVWLPRKIIPLRWMGSPYLAVGEDETFVDDGVGLWSVERP